MLKYREVDLKFADVWRVFISGSSSAGKTHFARELLKAELFKYKRIYYYHPDIQEDFPVDWSDHISKPILYQANLPTVDELLQIPHYSVIILDDLFTEACEDKNMSYLFRVLSSKRKLHVIIMTQRYFAEGMNALNIRNSSNYHVLMRNADARTNLRVGLTMNLKADFLKANEMNKKNLYPYIFVDRTNHASVNELQVYTDILSRYKRAVFKSMPSYILSEADFKAKFKILDQHTAIENASFNATPEAPPNSPASEPEEIKKARTEPTTRKEPTKDSTRTDRTTEQSGLDEYIKRRKFERKIADTLHRHNISS